MNRRIIQFILFSFILASMSFSIMVTDKLNRGNYYRMKFRLKSDNGTKRYVGLYTQKTLNADLIITDESGIDLVRVSGTSGKYPKQVTFPGAGVYTAKVMAYSGKGPFLMLISNREELKKVLKDVK